MQRVVFLDTSVLLNVLDVPRKNGERSDIVPRFKELAREAAVLMVIPIATVIEVGNHVAQLGRHERAKPAEALSKLLGQAVRGDAPFLVSGAAWDTQFLEDLIRGTEPARSLVVLCERGIGTGDGSILLELERFKRRTDLPSDRTVELWTLDKNLQSMASA